MGQPFNRLLSARHIVNFAGFRSDTFMLQRMGWQIAAREDMMEYRVELLLNYPPMGLKLFTKPTSVDFVRYDGMREAPLIFEVLMGGTEMRSQRMPTVKLLPYGEPQFELIDAREQMCTMPEDVGRWSIFAKPKEILIEPQSVAECMAFINKLQAPELAAIRERNRARDHISNGAQNAEVFQAQILSIAR